jgi:hypothetical protein
MTTRNAGVAAAGTLLAVALMSGVPVSTSVAAGNGRATAQAAHSSTGAQPMKKKHGIFFTAGPKTRKPPKRLGGYTMRKFKKDRSAFGADVTSVSPGHGKAIRFSIALTHYRVHSCTVKSCPTGSWRTWSNHYRGSVYYDSGTDLTIYLPKGTRAFYFYAEPNAFKTSGFRAVANGVSSGSTVIFGKAGAKFFGFYARGDSRLKKIEIHGGSGTLGFAVGEFGIGY